METALSTLRVLPDTKDEVHRFAEMLRSDLLSGNVNPLELTRMKKSIEAVFDALKTDLSDLALAEAEKYGKKTFETMGMKITVGENGTSYDYDYCQDPVYIRLKAEADKVNEKVKDRQGLLKMLKSPEIITDPETGETTTVNPPLKTSTTGIKVQLI